MTGRSFWRLVATNRVAGAFVSVFVLLGVVGALLGPALLGAAFTAGIRYQVTTTTTAAQRDLTAQTVGSPATGASADPAASGLSPEVDAVWGKQNDALTTLRWQMPAELRDATAAPVATVSMDPVPVLHPEGAVWPENSLTIGADPRYADRIELDAGTLPGAYGSGGVVEVVLATAAAQSVGWTVGEVRTLDFADGTTSDVRLSGTFSPLDPGDPYWVHQSTLLRASIVALPKETISYIEGYADPASWPALSELHSTARTAVWFGVRTAALTTASAPSIESEARAFVSKPHSLGPDTGQGQYALTASFTTKVPAALEAGEQRNAVTAQLVAMVLVGPAAVLLAIFIVITALWWRRRAPTWSLLTARGASPPQVAAVTALEALVYALPAAVVGWVLCATLGGLQPGVADGAVTLGVAVVVPVLFGAAAVARTAAAARPATRLAAVGRPLVELACLVFVAAAILLLVQKGAGGAASPSLDLLPTAAPVLIALAACLAALRLFSLALDAIARRLAGTRSTTGFLGAAQAARDARLAVAPLIAIGVSLSIVVFAAGVLATVQSGIHRQAAAEAGSSLTVYSLTFTEPEMASIASIDGVQASAPVLTDTSGVANVGSGRVPVDIIVVDSAQVRAVQQGFVAPTPLPPQAPASTASGPVPVIASGSAAAALKANDFTIRGQPVTVVGVQPDLSPLTTEQSWILVDTSYASTITGPTTSISRGLFRFGDGGPSAAQVDEARDRADSFATVVVPAEIEQTLGANPTTLALTAALLTAGGLSLLFSLVTIVMALALTAADRARLRLPLRALGVTRRQQRALRLWEIIPITVAAVVAGVAAGVASTLLVTATVDLDPFTGGGGQPPPVIPVAAIVAAAAGFLLASIVAATVSIASTTRRPPDQTKGTP
ncbi:FtsX-like permease family protein [Subtercola sp. YIM 133946]|uniref:FtsX-like permease family protein n=1 Tax=Subtercola sp. YIM 133946 TaxID=3118909 RepID=UPI002F95EB08